MKVRMKWLTMLCLLAACGSGGADSTNPLTGHYYGTASIEQPAGLGTVDLAFYFDVNSGVIQQATSYIDLDKTLLFPAVAPQINEKDVGPRVSGIFDLASFQLASDYFPSMVSGVDEPVSRRVVLTADSVTLGGAYLTGTYTETVTELTKDPLVISGSFTLLKPLPVTLDSGQDLNGDGCLDLDEIRRGGSNPALVEFSDISAAMSLRNAPTATLRVGNPPGPNCADEQLIMQSALEEYYGERQ